MSNKQIKKFFDAAHSGEVSRSCIICEGDSVGFGMWEYKHKMVFYWMCENHHYDNKSKKEQESIADQIEEIIIASWNSNLNTWII